jgi:hypothetical protein
MPRKKQPQRKQRLVKLNPNNQQNWEDILGQIDKKEVPVEVLQKVDIILNDGTVVELSMKELTDQGMSYNDIESALNERMTKMDQLIKNVDFFVDIDKLEAQIQPNTDKILKDL